jgi:hypothetical protein
LRGTATSAAVILRCALLRASKDERGKQALRFILRDARKSGLLRMTAVSER